MSKHKELLIRVYITVLVVIAVALALSYRVVKINVVEGERWRAKGDSLYVRYFPVEAERGDIIARNGELLATSQPLFEIRMDTRANGLTDELFRENVDSLAYYLSKYSGTGWTQSRYRNYLIRQRSRGARYLLIKRNVNYDELERFKRFPLFRLGQNKGGFIAERKGRRLFPYDYLARRTIGYVRSDVSVGLEGYFDAAMRGQEGKRLMQRVRNAWIPVLDAGSIPARRGGDIVTTIDVDMQDIVESELMRAVTKHQADWGTAVLMEVETGAIRAIANLEEQSGGGYDETYNHAVGSATEPGSTFKLAAVMSMLEDGLADLDTRVDLNNGHKRFHGQDMYDSHPHAYTESDMREAFEISSNVGIASLADDAYGKTKRGDDFIKRLNQFGLNRTTGIRIDGEHPPKIKKAYDYSDNWSALSIPWMAHGYEVQLTPLQTLAFYSAVANDGQMMRPRIVSAVINDGKVVERFEPEVSIERIASEETIRKAQELLRGVMVRGTGKDKQSPHVALAGKTGTAVVQYFLNHGGPKKYQGSFAGYFPADDPKYGLIVLVYHPTKGGYYGGTVALPAFRNIAEGIMALDPVQWNSMQVGPDTIRIEAPEIQLASLAYKADVDELAKRMGIQFSEVHDADWVNWTASDGDRMGATDVAADKMPDVRGMGLRDALFLIENTGMSVKVRGVGKVNKQSIRPGTNVSQGTQVILDLS